MQSNLVGRTQEQTFCETQSSCQRLANSYSCYDAEETVSEKSSTPFSEAKTFFFMYPPPSHHTSRRVHCCSA